MNKTIMLNVIDMFARTTNGMLHPFYPLVPCGDGGIDVAEIKNYVAWVYIMEIWDLYNKHREITGKEHIRGEKIPEGYYHLVVHVWIRNKYGKYLISQRAANRPTCPLMWECVGGSVLKGEESVDGAVREVKEEVGITLDPSKGEKVFSAIRDFIDGKSFRDIVDVWLFEYDGELQLQNATTDEVADCKWMSYDEIKSLYDSEKLVNTLDYFFDVFSNDRNSAN